MSTSTHVTLSRLSRAWKIENFKKNSTETVDNPTRLKKKKTCIIIDGPGNNTQTEGDNLLEGLRQAGFSDEVCQAFEGWMINARFGLCKIVDCIYFM